MTTAEVPIVIRHSVQVIDVTLRRTAQGRHLGIKERRRYEGSEVEALERVHDLRLDLDFASTSAGKPLRRRRGRTLSLKGPLKENRLRWITRIGGSRERDNFFDAFRAVLQRGQNLIMLRQ